MKFSSDIRSRRADLTTRHAIILVVGVLASLVVPARAKAGLTIAFTEAGDNVYATVDGNIDTAGLTMYGSVSLGGAELNPSIGYFHNSGTVGHTADGVDMNYYRMLSGPSSWGSGGGVPTATYTGDAFLINIAYGGYIELPYGYVSGSPIISTATWTDASLISLGLDTGTYTYTWGSGPTADSLIVQVGPGGPSAVPEPASIWLAAIGAAAIGLHVRFTRSKKQRRRGHPARLQRPSDRHMRRVTAE